MYKEPDTSAMEVDFPKRVALSAEEQAELEHTMTIFVSQMKPSLGLYGFKTLNLLRYIDDTQYDLDPPTTSKPSSYLNDKDRIEKRMRVFTDTMKYLGYSSRKKRGSDETEWWWDPFKQCLRSSMYAPKRTCSWVRMESSRVQPEAMSGREGMLHVRHHVLWM